LWKQDVVQDTLRNGAVPAALALVALAIVFGVLRPALKAAAAPAPAGRQLDAVVGDDIAMPHHHQPAMLEPPRASDKLQGARTLARDNPAAVATIVRTWVSKDA
jgi:flagellar M-ring protein FliF